MDLVHMLIWRKIDPALLDRDFLADLKAFFSELPGDWYVTAGFRTRKEQSRLHEIYLAGGPKAAPPGLSAHEYGLAIDIVLDCDPEAVGLQPSWNVKLQQWLTLKLHLLTHPTLKHGSSFGDWPHVEARNWQLIARKRYGFSH